MSGSLPVLARLAHPEPARCRLDRRHATDYYVELYATPATAYSTLPPPPPGCGHVRQSWAWMRSCWLIDPNGRCPLSLMPLPSRAAVPPLAWSLRSMRDTISHCLLKIRAAGTQPRPRWRGVPGVALSRCRQGAVMATLRRGDRQGALVHCGRGHPSATLLAR